MTENDLDEISELIQDVIKSFEASYLEAIYILDRLRYCYHRELERVSEEGEEDGDNDECC